MGIGKVEPEQLRFTHLESWIAFVWWTEKKSFQEIPTCMRRVRCTVLWNSRLVQLTGFDRIHDATPPVVFLIAHLTQVTADSELTDPGPKTIDTFCQQIMATLLEEHFSHRSNCGLLHLPANTADESPFLSA